jgi:hypothetical protein
MLSHEEAEGILKAATFRMHLGCHTDADGLRKEFFGTGFFVQAASGSDGLALTANHNFEGCVPGQIVHADYKGKAKAISLQWIQEESSERADIAVMRLVDKPEDVSIEGLRVGYLDPQSTMAARKGFFKDRVAVSIFGYPERDRGGEGWRIDGAVDASQPIIESYEGNTGSPPTERLSIHGARITDLEGISGAAILDREIACVIGVEGSYDVRWVVDPALGGYWKGVGDVRGSEIAGLVAQHPELGNHFERVEPMLEEAFGGGKLRPPDPEPPLPDCPYPLLEPYTHPRTFAGRARELDKLMALV